MAVPSRVRQSRLMICRVGSPLDYQRQTSVAVQEKKCRRAQLCAVSQKDQPKNPRTQEDGILMVVPVRIFGQEVRALIDSGATRCFISPAGVTRCGLTVESHHTFLELGDGKKVLSRGRAVDVPIVTSGYAVKINLTVSRLLHGVDVVLGVTWLKEAYTLIWWSTGNIYIPDSVSSFQKIMGQWLEKQVKIGTVKVLSTNEQLESLKQPSNAASIEILKSPQFWAVKKTAVQNSWRSSHAQGDALISTSKFFETTHPSFGILRVQKLNNNATLPKRSTEGAAGYDLCASQDCTIPTGGKGLVHTGISISFPAGLYARIAPRSGLALKRFIDVGPGVGILEVSLGVAIGALVGVGAAFGTSEPFRRGLDVCSPGRTASVYQ